MKINFTRILAFFTAFSTQLQAQNVSVLMQHGDQRGTGWNSRELRLTTSNVNARSFGKLFALPVDDQLYAQPLVISGLTVGGRKRNVLFAATTNNSVYAFDADSANGGNFLWKKNYTPAGQRPPTNVDMRNLGACGGGYNDFSRTDGSPATMGIVGTPVIDTSTFTLYFVSRNTNGTAYQQFLHAVDVTSGAERSGSPVLITATVPGTGDGSSGGNLSFNPAKHNQRPGLLLSKGIVYIAYASHCDNGPYHGWIFGYAANNLIRKITYNATPDGYNGGIWMSGAAPTADENGAIYVCIGNGSVATDGNSRKRGESIVKLTPNLTTGTLDQQTYFTPANYQELEGADLDFGVTEVMLIPNTTQAFTGCKDGSLYLVNRDNMGGFNSSTNNVLQTIALGRGKTLRSSFTYYRGTSKEFVYTWSENSVLKAFPYNRSTGRLDAAGAVSSGIQGPNSANNGVFMSASSNGSADGTAILWASHAANGDANQSVRPGILRAIDANDVTKELWNSNQKPQDNLSNYAKFVCPVVANGKVYMATFSNQLVVYGLTDTISQGNCTGTTDLALHRPAVSSSDENTTNAAAMAFDGNAATRWASAQGVDPQSIYVDLGGRYNICRVNLSWEVALGKDFKIQVSDDANTWSTLSTITGNTSFFDQISINGTGRYVRMLGSARGTPYGYSLYSFEVYGTAANTCVPPSNLAASNITRNGATMSWNAIPGVSSYHVQYKTVSAPGYTAVTAASNSLALGTLACGTDYLFKVQAVCSGTAQSDFSLDKSFSTGACDAGCGILPTRWSQQDIGAVGFAGQACYNNEVWRFQASGTDIWNTSDQFHFAYKTFSNDGQVTARVDSLDKANPWNKAGVMFRESTGADSRQAFICYTSGNGMAFQYRGATGGISTNNSIAGFQLPYYVKLVKRGSTFSGYVSQDSVIWKQIGPAVNLGFGATAVCYAGLAATAHDNSKISLSRFSKVPIVFSADTSVNTGGATCAGTNVALNRPGASSGNLSTDKSIYEFQAFDGNTATRWASKQGSDSAFLAVDLGKRVNICKVNINWAGEYGKNYLIQVSDDAVGWSTIYRVNGNTALVNSLPVSGTGRFVRMLGSLRGTTLGYSISEMGVFGSDAAGQLPNLALNKPAGSSSNEDGVLIPSAAVDGKGATRWASAAGVDPSWMYVDLGTVYNLSSVVLDWETALATDFQVQVSNDATTWTPVRTVTGNTAYFNVLAVNGTGRYVRVLGTKRGYPAGYSLYELQVYGQPLTASATTLTGVAPAQAFISLYPNPSRSSVIVSSGNAPMTELTIYNLSGQALRVIRAKGQTTLTVDLTGLQEGVHMIRITTAKGIFTRKLIKMESR